MYFYVFDSYLQDRRYATEVARIETRLGVLGIPGRQEKITILKNIQEAVTEAIKRGATTIVAVGNDKTVTKILPQVIEKGLTLGIIPVGPEQTIAESLGLARGVAACDSISRRVIRQLDVATANGQYFLLQLQAPANTTVMCDDTYSVESIDPNGAMVISNLSDAATGRPNDNQLELVVRSEERGGWGFSRRGFSTASVFPIHRAKIKTTDGTLLLDGQTVVKSPATVEVAKKKLGVIVGRGRRF